MFTVSEDISFLAAEYKRELRALTDTHAELVMQLVNGWNTLSAGEYAKLNNEIQGIREKIMSFSAGEAFGA